MWPFQRNTAFEVRSAEPYWLWRDGSGDAGPPLERSLDCDVAIIGAGITGALIADSLVSTGRRIVLLDAREPGQASTSASTALLQYEIDTHLSDLTRMLGGERAALAYRACVDAFDRLERRFPELLASCDYQRRQSLYLAARESDVDALRAELAARRAIGIRAEWLDGDELRRRHGLQRPGGIVSTPAASFDPLLFTRGLLSACARHGAEIFSRAKVESIAESGDALRLTTTGGQVITAQHVVVAAGYESLKYLPIEVADIDNTFALVTEPVDSRRADVPLIWESARPYLYIRPTRDGRLMIGGADVPFRSPAAREALLARQVGKLAKASEKLFGSEMPPIAHAWAGSFAKTRDGLPYVGRAPGMSSRLQFALCFGGNGITYAVQASDMIRAGIEGEAHPLTPVFSFERGGFQRLGTDPAVGRPDRRRAGGVAAS